jgi:low temperature requirement protein LtrA
VTEQPFEREERVSPLELFFDLVFVFGLTQVTTVLSDNSTWSGLGHALLILVALWWAWSAYAWLTNAVDPSEGLVWGTMMVAMAAMFVAALALPEAFGDHGVVFGTAFFIVAVMQLALYALSARGDRDLIEAILRIAPSAVSGAALILAAGFLHGAVKTLLWMVALAIGFIGPLFVDPRGWRLHPGHFVERHGLIVIIAIGESLVAIGIGARGTVLDTGVIVAALLGFVVAASFWLAYFDFLTIRARQLLTDRSGTPRIALARDVFTYLHLPMIVGIVLFAFALKTTIAHIGDELAAVPAFACASDRRSTCWPTSQSARASPASSVAAVSSQQSPASRLCPLR